MKDYTNNANERKRRSENFLQHGEWFHPFAFLKQQMSSIWMAHLLAVHSIPKIFKRRYSLETGLSSIINKIIDGVYMSQPILYDRACSPLVLLPLLKLFTWEFSLHKQWTNNVTRWYDINRPYTSLTVTLQSRNGWPITCVCFLNHKQHDCVV